MDTPYSKMTIAEAEARLNFGLDEVKAMPVDRMLAMAKHSVNADVDAMREKIYERLVEHIESEGYPTEANKDYKEANVNDLVYGILSPMVTDLKRKTGRKLRLTREKEIISKDNETGGCRRIYCVG